MKISASRRRPVIPSNRVSRPDGWRPSAFRLSRSASSRSPENAVPSIVRPSSEPTLPPSISRTWATVIRDGIACGLIRRSGVMPSRVYGMFSGLTISPMTPFWPCRLANLSPSSDPLVADLDLDELGDVLPLRQDHVVDPAGLAVADRPRRLPPLLRREQVGLLLEEAGGARL